MNARVKLMNSQPADLDRLYEVFHENTKHFWSQNLEVGERIGRYLHTERSIRETATNYKTYRLLPRINLPAAEALPTPLSTALADRISVRDFRREQVSLQTLSNLLHHAFACNREAESVRFRDITLRFRSYPSGGGLYPVEIYPVLLNVANAPLAVTHYDPVNHRLSVIRDSLDLDEFGKAFLGDNRIVKTAAFLIVFTCIFERTTVKYGDRGYRLCLLEAGHAAQNVCLTATSQELGTLTYGGYDDDAVARWLGVDGLSEAVVHAVFGGRPGLPAERESQVDGSGQPS